MNNPLVSIIIPCYNIEKYIDVCLNSLLKQTYINIEIICINDWSTDKTLDILQEYEIKDRRVKLYSQKNQWVWFARNYGLGACKWEYLTFVDGDDYLDDDYIQSLLSEIEDNDIIVSWYRQVDTSGKVIFQRELKKYSKSMFRQMIVWGKLYRTELFIKNKIRFNQLKRWEDACFTWKCYSNTQNIKISSYVGYNCVRREGSATQDSTLKIQNNSIKIFNEIELNDFVVKNLNWVTFFLCKEVASQTINQLWKISLKDQLNFVKINTSWIKNFYTKNNLKFNFIYNLSEPFYVNFITLYFFIWIKLDMIFLGVKFLYFLCKIWKRH